MREYRLRSVIKAVSWRLLATFTTILIVFIFTRKLLLSLGIGVVEVTAKILFYYFHERIWSTISWGKPKHPLEDIAVKKELTPEDKEDIKKRLEDLGYM